MTSSILDAMNAKQIEAITAGSGPVLVIAGPGSGKTRVLTHRIAYLIQEQNLPAYRIMAVTFTNKAAQEMKERITRLIGEASSQITLGTFHAICLRILRREAEFTAPFTRDSAIFDSQDQVSLIKKILVDLQIDSTRFQPWSVLNQISAAKNELISASDFPAQTYPAQIVKQVYEAYVDRLRASNARDFDDILVHTVQLLRKHPEVLERYQRYYQYILVDEFQDTNMVQYELIRLLAGGPQGNVFVVGDPDQSIYAFRGADYRNVKRFQADFAAKSVVLEENYRSHQYILDAATAIIRENADHIKRRLFSQRESGPKIVIHESYNERDEAQFVLEKITEMVGKGQYRRGDVAVLYRLNAQSRVLEETFIRAGMPYMLVGATHFYGRKEIKDILAYLRVVQNPVDSVSLERIINVPPRGIGDKTVDQLFAWGETFTDGAWGALQALARGEESPLGGRARNVLTPFATMLMNLRERIETSTPLELLDMVLDETRYMEHLQRDRSEQGVDRVENVIELRRVANEYATTNLAEFLNELALVSDVDALMRQKNFDAPTLLTLHAAKGLEYPVVFIVGLEEGILPHNRSLEDENQMAEERRLMYVGLTRAKDHVYLVYAFRRMMWGHQDMTVPSRFLENIPPDITSGFARVPQPKADHPFYLPKWETDWPAATPTPSQAQPRPDARRDVQRQSRREARPDANKPATYEKGQRISHQRYGAGIVLNTRFEAGIEIVEVLFPQHGKKDFEASFIQSQENAADKNA